MLLLELLLYHVFNLLFHEFVNLNLFLLVLELFGQELSLKLEVFHGFDEFEFLKFLGDDFLLHLESFLACEFKRLEFNLLDFHGQMTEELVLIPLLVLHLFEDLFLG
jgi:hypothetical protein